MSYTKKRKFLKKSKNRNIRKKNITRKGKIKKKTRKQKKYKQYGGNNDALFQHCERLIEQYYEADKLVKADKKINVLENVLHEGGGREYTITELGRLSGSTLNERVETHQCILLDTDLNEIGKVQLPGDSCDGQDKAGDGMIDWLSQAATKLKPEPNNCMGYQIKIEDPTIEEWFEFIHEDYGIYAKKPSKLEDINWWDPSQKLSDWINNKSIRVENRIPNMLKLIKLHHGIDSNKLDKIEREMNRRFVEREMNRRFVTKKSPSFMKTQICMVVKHPSGVEVHQDSVVNKILGDDEVVSTTKKTQTGHISNMNTESQEFANLPKQTRSSRHLSGQPSSNLWGIYRILCCMKYLKMFSMRKTKYNLISGHHNILRGTIINLNDWVVPNPLNSKSKKIPGLKNCACIRFILFENPQGVLDVHVLLLYEGSLSRDENKLKWKYVIPESFNIHRDSIKRPWKIALNFLHISHDDDSIKDWVRNHQQFIIIDVMRHGDAIHNSFKDIKIIDSELTQTGIEQSIESANFANIYASEMVENNGRNAIVAADAAAATEMVEKNGRTAIVAADAAADAADAAADAAAAAEMVENNRRTAIVAAAAAAAADAADAAADAAAAAAEMVENNRRTAIVAAAAAAAAAAHAVDVKTLTREAAMFDLSKIKVNEVTIISSGLHRPLDTVLIYLFRRLSPFNKSINGNGSLLFTAIKSLLIKRLDMLNDRYTLSSEFQDIIESSQIELEEIWNFDDIKRKMGLFNIEESTNKSATDERTKGVEI